MTSYKFGTSLTTHAASLALDQLHSIDLESAGKGMHEAKNSATAGVSSAKGAATSKKGEKKTRAEGSTKSTEPSDKTATTRKDKAAKSSEDGEKTTQAEGSTKSTESKDKTAEAEPVAAQAAAPQEGAQ